MKLIGKGSFTKAYLNDSNEVILKTQDYTKECMALGWLPESKLIPKVEYIESGVYKMEYLGKTPKSLKQELRPRQYRLYQELRKLFNNGFGTVGTKEKDKFFAWHDNFNKLPSEFKKEKEILKEALDSFGNFGTDINFEISPRNVRSKNGFLVLLDCFFFSSQLKQSRGL